MKEPIFVTQPQLLGVQRPEKEFPIFAYSVNIQDLFCNISKKDGKIVAGDKGHIKSRQFIVWIQRHTSPDLAAVGHYWKVKAMEKTGELKQIV